MTQLFASIRSAIAAIGVFGFLLIYFQKIPDDTLFITALSTERLIFYILSLSLAGTASLFVLGRYSTQLLWFNLSISVFLLEYPHWFLPCPLFAPTESMSYAADLLILPAAFILAAILSKIVLWSIVLPIKNVTASEQQLKPEKLPLFSEFLDVRVGIAAFLFTFPHIFITSGLSPLITTTLPVFAPSLFLAFLISFLSMRLFTAHSFHYTIGGLFGGIFLLLLGWGFWPKIRFVQSGLPLNYPLLHSSIIGVSVFLAWMAVQASAKQRTKEPLEK